MQGIFYYLLENLGANYDCLTASYNWRCQVMILAKARSYERLRRVDIYNGNHIITMRSIS